MSTKVGEGYIEVKPKFDSNTFSRMAQLAGRNAATSFTKNFSQHISKDIRGGFRNAFDGVDNDVDRATTRIHQRYTKKVDRDSSRWGGIMSGHIGQAFEGLLSLLPARFETIFTKTGPILGTVLMAGVTAAVALAAPALGAIITGGLFLTVGLGAAVAAAFVGAAHDARVKAAATRLKETFISKIVDDPAVSSLGGTLAAQLDKVSAALSRWAPHIQSILKAGEKFLGPTTDAIIQGMTILIGALDRVANSTFMTGLVRVFNAGMVKIMNAIATSFDRMLRDPKAIEGATKGLELFLNMIASTIMGVFDLLRWLSRLYDSMSAKGGTFDRVRATWKAFKDGIDAVAHSIHAAFNALRDTGVFQAFGAIIIPIINWIRGSAVPAVRAFATEVANRIKPAMAEWAVILKNNVAPALRNFQAAWAQLWPKIKPVVSLLAGFIASNTLGVFSNFLKLVTVSLNLFAFTLNQAAFSIRLFSAWLNILKVAIGVFRRVWDATWNAVHLYYQAVWHFIVLVGRVAWNAIFAFFRGQLNAFRGYWSGIWNSIYTIFHFVWIAIPAYAVRAWNAIFNFFRIQLTGFRAFWARMWNDTVRIVASVWSAISRTVRNVWTSVSSWVVSKLSALRKTWGDIWNGIYNILGGVWGKIQNTVRSGINGVIGIINKGIDLINGVLGKLGVSFRIGKIGLIGGSAISATASKALASIKPDKISGGRAGGGRIYGTGSTTSDSNLYRLSRDEYVLRADRAREIGYSNLDHLNRNGTRGMGAKGYASGGRVGAGNNALLNEHRNHLHIAMSGPPMSYPQIIAAAKRSHLPYSVGSTYRAGSRAGNGNLDHHSEGRAVDFPGFNQDALASYFLNVPGVIEEIHRTATRDYAIFGGKGDRSGGVLSGLLAWVGKGWNWVMQHLLGPVGNKAKGLIPGGNFIGEFGKGVIGKIFDGATGKAKGEFDSAKSAIDSGIGGGSIDQSGAGGAGRWSSVASLALKMLGLPQSWLGPLLRLISRESGGNPRAINLTDSNARAGHPSKGLMQTIGPTFESYKYPGHNNIYAPLDNILAGLRYINSRYRTIFNVQQAVGATPRGYDNGGWAAPGMNWNGTGKPEMMLNSAQGLALEKSIASLGSHVTHVYVDGVEVAHRAVVEENNAALVRSLRTGTK